MAKKQKLYNFRFDQYEADIPASSARIAKRKLKRLLMSRVSRAKARKVSRKALKENFPRGYSRMYA